MVHYNADIIATITIPEHYPTVWNTKWVHKRTSQSQHGHGVLTANFTNSHIFLKYCHWLNVMAMPQICYSLIDEIEKK